MHIAILLRPSIRWNGFAIKVLFLNCRCVMPRCRTPSTPTSTGKSSHCTSSRSPGVISASKARRKRNPPRDRFIPIPAKLVWKIKDRMRERNAQPHDLVFPNGNGKPDGHFLRKLKAIAKKAEVEGAELHRYRKTYADTLHEEGVSVNTIRIRLGHESLDVTLAYLKGKDAESEEAQEHANSSSLALYA